MTCSYCNDTGWFLYFKDAPSPPYKQGMQLEYGKECICRGPQRPAQNFKGEET